MIKSKLTMLGYNTRLAAISGAAAWVIYGIAECIFSSILPWVIRPGYDYVPLHPGFTALLFILYPLIGGILGGGSGLALHLAQNRIPVFQRLPEYLFISAFGTFTVVLAFSINFILNYYGSIGLSELPPLGIALLLILALISGMASNAWFTRLRFLTNPLAVSFVLLGLPWINQEVVVASSLGVKAVVALSYPSLIFLISFSAQKIVDMRSAGESETSLSVYTPRPLLHIALIALFVLVSSALLKQQPLVDPQSVKSSGPPKNVPNVILIVMDTVRADHLSLYGYHRDTTPNIQKLADEATVYTHAIAPSDMTLPAHASILTGLYGTSHGAHYEGPKLPEARPLRQDFVTLAEILSEKGYFTGAVVANTAYLHYDFGLNQGFQFYDQRHAVPLLGPQEFYATGQFYIRKSVRDILSHLVKPPLFDQRYRRAEDINESVFAYLERARDRNAPFFLFVNYMDAHEPYIPPPPFDKYYSDKKATFTLANYYKMQEDVMRRERNITNHEYDFFLSQYDGGIAYIDYHFEDLIKQLRQSRLYENTLIIITSDHGEVFGNRSLIGHSSSVYQDQVYVPLIIKFPKISEKKVIQNFVGIIDLMPTVLDALGFDVPGQIHGKSLLELGKDGTRVMFSESFPNPTFIKWHPRFNRYERAIFRGSYKLINSSSGKRELYDLGKDPRENNNLYEAQNEIAKELESRLNEWLALAKASVRKNDSDIKLDQDTVNRLKSLGYVR